MKNVHHTSYYEGEGVKGKERERCAGERERVEKERKRKVWCGERCGGVSVVWCERGKVRSRILSHQIKQTRRGEGREEEEKRRECEGG